MKGSIWQRGLLAVAACIVSTAAMAGDVGLESWGPRFGLTDDPDQVVAGVHFDMGELAPHVRWQPNFEVGFGDDVTSLSGNVLFAYYFGQQGGFTPYAGGQLAVAYFDVDDGNNHDHGDGGTEFGFDAVGGFETKMGSASRFLLELQLGFGDVHNLKVVAGFKF